MNIQLTPDVRGVGFWLRLRADIPPVWMLTKADAARVVMRLMQTEPVT